MALVLNPATLSIAEGSSARYTVALAKEPTSRVSVTIWRTPVSAVDTRRSSLTFAPANWNVPPSATRLRRRGSYSGVVSTLQVTVGERVAAAPGVSTSMSRSAFFEHKHEAAGKAVPPAVGLNDAARRYVEAGSDTRCRTLGRWS